MIEAMIQSAQEVIPSFLFAVVVICFACLLVWFLIIGPATYIAEYGHGLLASLYFIFIIGVFIWLGNTIRILIESGSVVIV